MLDRPMDEPMKEPGQDTERRLRIGLLVDGPWVSKYDYGFVEWAADRQNIEITHLIIHARQGAEGSKTRLPKIVSRLVKFVEAARRRGIYSSASDAISILLFSLIVRVERRFINPDSYRSFDISALVRDSIIINPKISKSGFVYRFDPADIERVRALNLDLLIRLGTGILRGDILHASRLGVISFHHADNRVNRGGPAAFWEVYHRQDTTGFTLQRLTDELDGGEVLLRGNFGTRGYYLLNRVHLFEKSIYHLKFLVDKIARTGRLPDALQDTPYTNKLFRRPRAHEALMYLANQFWRRAKRIYRKINMIYPRWGVAFARSDWPEAVLWRGVKLETPPLHFLADPFVITKDGRDYCFVEDYDYTKRRGDIAVYDITKDDGVRVGTALDEGFHLSFPFLFEYDNQLFMCPETHQTNDIRIYRCVEFPLGWTLEKVIMREVSAADTMLFEKSGKWWMLTNIDPTKFGDYCDQLFVFSSDSPLSDEWRPHPLNPIFVDASRARNAGLVKDGDKYFRVSQGQGYDVYGKRALINEIVELTESKYIEACIGEITPTFAEGLVGAHHLHSNGRVTAFDFVAPSRIKSGLRGGKLTDA